jgi:carbamoyltransferase
MDLPSLALHRSHNASISVYHDSDILTVIEFERLLNLKNASYDAFRPIHSQNFILKHIYDFLKENYGFLRYENFIIGEGTYTEFPEEYKKQIPSNNYIIDNSHHPAHASNSLYQSNFDEALIISFDGGSLDGNFNIYTAKKEEELNKIFGIYLDLGSHYHVFASVCDDIKNYDCLTAAGKILGLQSYGDIVREWMPYIKEFYNFKDNYWVNLEQRLFNLGNQIGLELSYDNKLKGQNAYNLARTSQEVFEELFFENVDPIVEKYNLPIILTGGCALNIVLNTKVKSRYCKDVFVAPNSSDCGLSVGLLCKHFKPKKQIDITYKGIKILDKNMLASYCEDRNGSEYDIEKIVNDLVSNRIIGIVQCESEHGPRALGNRSIICSPLDQNMKNILNDKIKHREWFRPFAPIVRLEDVSEYFEWEGESRWMNFCPNVRPEYVDKIPAVVHVDGTARVQTITREQNQFMYDLLTLFKEKSGIGVLINTSFNVDGKPILSTYKDAFKVYDETDLDCLYLDGYYFSK